MNTRHSGNWARPKTGIALLALLALLAQGDLVQATPRLKASQLKPGRVSFPVTVRVNGRPVQGRFEGVARQKQWSGGYVSIYRPRIVVRGKEHYVGQHAAASLFSHFDAANSGQSLVWGQSVTRHPQNRWRPTKRPPLVEIVRPNGPLELVKKKHARGRWVYYNGPDGWLSRRAQGQDRIGIIE